MQIVPVDDTLFKDVVAFVDRHNNDPAQHVTYFGANAAEAEHALQTLREAQLPLFAALETDQIVGVLGLDYDSEIGRVWVHGPIIAAADWNAVADDLYHAAQAALNQSADHEMSFDLENIQGITFAEQRGFEVYGDCYILFVDRSQLATIPAQQAEPYRAEFAEQFIALQNSLFPSASTTAQQILKQLDEQHRLLLMTDGDTLLGYIYAVVEPQSGEAFIDFVGVSEAARGRGIGRKLVQAGVHWLFRWPSIENVCLVVRTDNASAYHLYTSAGFKRERTFRALRKDVAIAQAIA